MPAFSWRALGLLLLSVGILFPISAFTRAAPDPDEITKLIEQLGSDDAAQRKEAAKSLEEIGEPAVEALRQASKSHADPDVRLRAGVLIRAIEGGQYGEIKSLFGGTRGYWINRVAFSADGKQALAAGGAVIWFDLDSGKEVNRILEVGGARPGLALSKDGRLVLTGHAKDQVFHLCEAKSGKVVQKFEGHTAGIMGVALSPDGSRAVSAGDDGTLRLWEVKTGRELRAFKEITEKVRCVAFSPDGRQVASGHFGPKSSFLVRLWDADSGKEIRSFKGHSTEVTAVAFLPDGRSILSASMDGTLRLWDVDSGKELRQMKHDGGAYDAAVSPDGKRALSAGFGDKTMRLWDLTTGRELHRFEGHNQAVLGVAFSSDSKRALSSDANCTVRLWRLAK
jgi:WD40 repeat protein